MNELTMLLAIFNLIKTNGTLDKVDGPRLGGPWSADTYRLYGNIAQLADDGCSQIVRREKFSANTTYGRPVEYFNTGNKNDLIDFYNVMFPDDKQPHDPAFPSNVVTERSYYIWL